MPLEKTIGEADGLVTRDELEVAIQKFGYEFRAEMHKIQDEFQKMLMVKVLLAKTLTTTRN